MVYVFDISLSTPREGEPARTKQTDRQTDRQTEAEREGDMNERDRWRERGERGMRETGRERERERREREEEE